MYLLNTIRLITGAVGRSSVIKGTASPGHVHLPGDDVVPDTGQILHQLLFAGFGIHIRHPGIQVIGTHRMPHRPVLFTERNAVLIIIRTIFHHPPDVYQILRQFQVTRIPRGAVHLDYAHIMGRADGVTGQFGGSGFIEMTQEIGGTDGCLKKGGLPGGTAVDDGGHHQMSQVVGFKVQPVGKGSFLVFGTHLGSDDCLPVRFFRQGMGVDAFVQFADDDRGMDISVRPLGFYDAGYETVHQLVQFGVFVDGID